MTTRIFKYALGVDDTNDVEMPDGAQVLCVQTQNEDPCIWAKVDTEAPRTIRRFRTFGTGYMMDPRLNYAYVGTYQLRDGGLVFHVFEVQSAKEKS